MGETGGGMSYVLNRSIAARGTTAYEQITDEQGVLSPQARAKLQHRLQSIQQAMPCEDPHLPVVREFLAVLNKSAAEASNEAQLKGTDGR